MQVSSPATRHNSLTRWIIIALIVGVVVGSLCHELLPAALLPEIAGYFQIGIDVFLRLIKMIIAPLVFGSIVSGIVSLGDGAAVGRIAGRALAWFLAASLVSIGLGISLANLMGPGVGMNLTASALASGAALPGATLSVRDFVTHLVPTSAFQAMSSNEILQILVFSVFFGLALIASKGTATSRIAPLVDELVQVMLRITDVVMVFAPFGVFAAMAAVVTTYGPDVLITYGKFVASFYVSLAILWLVLVGAGAIILKRRIISLLKLLREPMMIAFATASSEAAFPKMIEQLFRFGVARRISGFVLPLGYSFNLDGSMMYQAFATLFIAQAYGIHMGLGTQIGLLLIMMLTSKGIAGVPRAGLVVVIATLPYSHLPPEGVLLIVGIDQVLDMGRTMTNVIGNGIATAVVAKWEGELGVPEDAVASPRHGSDQAGVQTTAKSTPPVLVSAEPSPGSSAKSQNLLRAGAGG
jgi:Na+/H+-dicarboxylate symporter